MKPLAEAFAVEHGCEMEDADTGETLVCRNCAHLAAVVAEWLASDEAVEVVAHWIGLSADTPQAFTPWEEMSRPALAALAAHAKGEADG